MSMWFGNYPSPSLLASCRCGQIQHHPEELTASGRGRPLRCELPGAVIGAVLLEGFLEEAALESGVLRDGYGSSVSPGGGHSRPRTQPRQRCDGRVGAAPRQELGGAGLCRALSRREVAGGEAERPEAPWGTCPEQFFPSGPEGAIADARPPPFACGCPAPWHSHRGRADGHMRRAGLKQPVETALGQEEDEKKQKKSTSVLVAGTEGGKCVSGAGGVDGHDAVCQPAWRGGGILPDPAWDLRPEQLPRGPWVGLGRTAGPWDTVGAAGGLASFPPQVGRCMGRRVLALVDPAGSGGGAGLGRIWGRG